jgi:hypothetical protein
MLPPPVLPSSRTDLCLPSQRNPPSPHDQSPHFLPLCARLRSRRHDKRGEDDCVERRDGVGQCSAGLRGRKIRDWEGRQRFLGRRRRRRDTRHGQRLSCIVRLSVPLLWTQKPENVESHFNDERKKLRPLKVFLRDDRSAVQMLLDVCTSSTELQSVSFDFASSVSPIFALSLYHSSSSSARHGRAAA